MLSLEHFNNDWNAIQQRIADDFIFYETHLEMVPPNIYFSDWNEEEVQSNLSNFRKKKEKKNQNRQKQHQLDPTQYKTVPYIIQQRAKEKKKSFSNREDLPSDIPSDEEEENSKEDDYSGTVITGFKGVTAEREELQKRLQEKISEIRKKRKADDQTKGPDAKRRKTEKETKEKDRKVSAGKVPALKQIKKQSIKFENNEEKSTQKSTSHSPSFDFASFDFSTNQPIPSFLKDQREQLHKEKQRKPNKALLLRLAQERKAEMEALKKTPEGEKIVEGQAWENMLKKAQGEKVKDDVKKLKKSLQREQQKKKKSAREWKQRIDNQKRSQAMAQKKRQQNIDAHRQRKNERRSGGKAKKKNRPGFEGKKNQFINKGKKNEKKQQQQ